ncbi:MAG: bifunctional precorrin-2 dehydrogenase/sirohydrochlorin ferrochelatase [candidate division Zixibacteria bacterium]|nr:bifunctional precorrin-2 dehydrogenase/sirohydrochlorin ferrochelatase [candidate division Zixibacteria bacterium]
MKPNKEYLPVNLKIEGKHFVVVGGGKVASRKLDLLAVRGADTTLIAPEVNERIKALEKQSLVKVFNKEYDASDLDQADYVIAATDDKDLNHQIYEECQKRNIPINVVDDPKYCDFIFPSILRRGPVTFTVSTGGGSPFLSAFLRQIMENAFGEEWEFIAKLAERYRKQVMERFKDRDDIKADCYKRFLDVNWVGILRNKGENEAEEYYNQLLNSLEEI